MSIKGIDTQIMINRSADFSRDTSALNRRPEMAQTNLAEQQKINDAEQQNRVAKTLESEMDRIRPDEDGGRGGAHGGRREGEEAGGEDEDGSGKPFLYVPPSHHIVDITI